MPDLHTYTQDAFPSDLRWQAVSFMRIAWPFIDGGLFRETYPASSNPTHFVVVEDGILLSYAATIQMDVLHGGDTYRMLGLGNVLTYPAHRHRGVGTRVVSAATEFIATSDADVAALFCDHDLAGFYEACGWEPITSTSTVIGTDHSAHEHDALRMMRFVSAKGTAAAPVFRSQPLQLAFDW